MRKFLVTLLLIGVALTGLRLSDAGARGCAHGGCKPTTTTTTVAPTTTTTAAAVTPLAYDLDCQGGTHDTVTLSDLDGVSIRNCQFNTNAFVQLTRVSHAVVDGNTFTADGASGAASIVDKDGSNNRITNNRTYGAGDAVGCCFVGFDDGLILENVRSDVVRSNTFDKTYDCGIESLGYVYDTTIDGNTITNNRTCGIGGWYDLDWQRNVVSDNRVSGSQLMFRFFWQPNLLTVGQFTDNQFLNNASSGMLTTASNGVFRTDAPIVASGNVLSDNDFAHAEQFAPQFYPNTDAYVGSGNLCGTRSQSGGSGPCP